MRRVEDITEALWGTRVSSGTVSRLNQKIYRHIEAWRNRAIEGEFPYLYLDGVILKRSWAGEIRNISVLVAIGIGTDGFRHILGVAEGEKEDLEGWRGFLRVADSWLDALTARSYHMLMGHFKLPAMRVFVINDPAWVERILIDEPQHYPKHRHMHEALAPLIGSSPFTTNGEQWQQQPGHAVAAGRATGGGRGHLGAPETGRLGK